MTGAVFVLAINIAIAMTMAIAFFAVGYFDTRNRAANWFGVAFLFAVVSFATEYVLHAGMAGAGVRLLIALAMLACFLTIGYALARRYEVKVTVIGLTTIFLASTVLYVLILDLRREDLLRQALYQVPYALVTLLGPILVWQSGRRGPADMALIVVLVLTALTFIAKPVVAALTGGVGAEAQDYATTLYALISQSSGGIAALVLAMLCLALVVSDSAASLVRRSERDEATGLLNRNGFEQHGARRLAASVPDGGHDVAMVLFAIDGSDAAGATPALAEAFAGIFGPEALIARLAGRTFVAILPQTNLFGARRQAEMLRVRFAAGTLPVAGLATVSIGIAEREPGDSLSDMLSRAQWALEEAHRAGGNCVRLAARAALGTTQSAG